MTGPSFLLRVMLTRPWLALAIGTGHLMVLPAKDLQSVGELDLQGRATYAKCRSSSVELFPPTQLRASRGWGMSWKRKEPAVRELPLWAPGLMLLQTAPPWPRCCVRRRGKKMDVGAF